MDWGELPFLSHTKKYCTFIEMLCEFCFQEWISVLKAKQSYFMAIANYYQGVVAREKGRYGENVTLMKVF